MDTTTPSQQGSEPSQQRPDASKHELLDLIKIVLLDQKLNVRDKKKLIGELRKLSPFTGDRWVFRLIISFLGAGIVFTIGATLWLVLWEKQSPDGLLALGSAAVGALAGFLTPLAKTNE